MTVRLLHLLRVSLSLAAAAFAVNGVVRDELESPSDRSQRDASSLAAIRASYQAFGQARQLTGTVSDLCKRVLPGTAVTVVNQTAATARMVTDGEGRYAFGALAPGSWTITFEIAGFQKKEYRIRLPENGDPVEHSVKVLPDLMFKQELVVTHSDPNLRYRRQAVYGVVTGPGGEPISSATIRFRDVGSGASRLVTELCTTDELGHYAVWGWSPTATRWQLSVAADGYRPYTPSDFELTPDEPRTLNIRLRVQ